MKVPSLWGSPRLPHPGQLGWPATKQIGLVCAPGGSVGSFVPGRNPTGRRFVSAEPDYGWRLESGERETSFASYGDAVVVDADGYNLASYLPGERG